MAATPLRTGYACTAICRGRSSFDGHCRRKLGGTLVFDRLTKLHSALGSYARGHLACRSPRLCSKTGPIGLGALADLVAMAAKVPEIRA